jgi:uncharacterized protein YndB with AHSA1/START domain
VTAVTLAIDAPVEDVFAVLADPYSYGHWVVGSDTIRDADPGWPAQGTRFHHRVGTGPVKTNDHTEVLDVNRPYLLELKANARPFGTAKVTLLLSPRRPDSTEVTMVETAGDALSRVLFNPLVQPLLVLRNKESLRRLKQLAEERARAASGGR